MPRASLTQKIVLPLGAVVLLLQIGLSAYALQHEREALLAQLDHRAARLAKVRCGFNLPATPPDDEATAQWIGTTMLEQQDVLFCEVIVGDDQPLFRGGVLEEEPCRRYAFPIETTDASGTGRASAKGTLYLALSTADIERSLAGMRSVLAVTIVAGTVVAMIAATLLIRHTVGHTLRRLLKNVRVATTRNLGDLATSQSHDRVEQLTQMLDTITRELQDIVEDEKRLTARTLSERVQQQQLWERSRAE